MYRRNVAFYLKFEFLTYIMHQISFLALRTILIQIMLTADHTNALTKYRLFITLFFLDNRLYGMCVYVCLPYEFMP